MIQATGCRFSFLEPVVVVDTIIVVGAVVVVAVPMSPLGMTE